MDSVIKITEENVIRIARIFIGDDGDLYPYMSGPQIVAFFNNHMGESDKYERGFPARWEYTSDKIRGLIAKNRFNEFINVIVNHSYLSSVWACSLSDGYEKAEAVMQMLNSIVALDGYTIINNNGTLEVVEQQDDLILLGSGGFADAYLQRSTGLVIKKLKSDFLVNKSIKSRFKREYNIMLSLKNVDGVIDVYSFDDNTYSYTMKKAQMTLEQYIDSNSINDDKKESIIKRILTIMSEVHKKGIIHRDLSPNNIFYDNEDILIADFGLGKDLNVFASHKTQFTKALGQARYCAPEVYMLLKDGDKQSDVFSLGRIINFIMNRDPNNSSHCYRAVVEKAVSTDSIYRYSDAGQMLNALNRCIDFRCCKERTTIIKEKIQKSIFDTSVEEYIYEQSGESICNSLIKKDLGYSTILRNFMNINDDHALHIISLIDKNLKVTRYSFESYDPIADFCYTVINNYSYMVNSIAASILRYIAVDVNRFHAQHLINELIDNGVEPMIEDTLLNS